MVMRDPGKPAFARTGNDIMNGSSKYKFMATVAFMFLLPFLVLSLHFARGYKELEKIEVLGRMGLRTRTAANAAADLLERNYNAAGLAASPGFINTSGEARRKMLESRIKDNPSIYSEFVVLSASGKETLKTGQTSASGLQDHSKTELFKKTVAGFSPAGAVEYGEYTPPVLVMIAPIPAGRGAKAEGFLLARMSLAYLGETVRVMGRSSYGDLGLLDAGGQLISDSLGYSIMTPGIKAPAEVLRVVNAAITKGFDDLKKGNFSKGRTHLVSVSRISGTRWWIFETADAVTPLNYAYTFWVRRVILTGVLLIFIFSFISYRLALRWLTPRSPAGQGT
jgi:hypothetical protein